jgi:hypothetical protein
MRKLGGGTNEHLVELSDVRSERVEVTLDQVRLVSERPPRLDDGSARSSKK